MSRYLLMMCFFLASCSTVDGAGKYRIESIGNAQRSVFARVLSAESVYIKEATSGAGAAVGGAVGGGLTSGNSDNTAVIIAGIIAGAVVGEYIEGQASLHTATEYIIKTEKGVLLTVAQIDSGNKIFGAGDNVVLVYGYPARLLAAPGELSIED